MYLTPLRNNSSNADFTKREYQNKHKDIFKMQTSVMEQFLKIGVSYYSDKKRHIFDADI